MNKLIANVPFFVLLATGVFLLLHNHYIAGGFLVFISIQAVQVD